MFFPELGHHPESEQTSRKIYLYQNGKPNEKPLSYKLTKNKSSFKDISKLFRTSSIRIYNSEGSEYFEEDMDFIKNGSTLYVSRGEEFDQVSCFAEYELEKLLGEGGFGKVYLAEHKQTKEKYAIKIIKTENIGSASDIDAIFVEAEILKSLRHQNIVRVEKCLTMKNMEVVIIMEFLEGGDLEKYVSRLKTLDEETARIFIRQVAKGMLYCHQNNLTHRDLKLQNILLVNSEQKKIKIIDFGIAGAISSMKWEQLDAGSLNYMAPEFFISPKNCRFDGRIDVWAIGVILYAMLCGELPFKGSTASETISSIKTGVYKIPSSRQKKLSHYCLDFLESCLDPDPKTRITMDDLNNHRWLEDDIFGSQKANSDLPEQVEYEEMPLEDRVVEKLIEIGNTVKNSHQSVSKGKKASLSQSKQSSRFSPAKKSTLSKVVCPKSKFS